MTPGPKFFLFMIMVVVLGSYQGCSNLGNLNSHELRKFHRQILTIDTHCDTPMRLRRQEFNIGERHEANAAGGQVDLIRMREGGLDAIVFAVFIAQGERTPDGYARAQALVQETLDAINRAVTHNSQLATIAYSPADVTRIVKEGKIAIILGLENGYPIGEDLGMITKYYQQGIRYITLCHTKNNQICDSSNDKPEHGGLSPFGVAVVQEMNRVGMIVDISHVSDSAYYDVLKITKAPVIASHSSVRAVCDNPRNLDDDMLRALKQNGGVVQINLFTDYIKKIAPNTERDSVMRQWWSKYDYYENMSPELRQRAYQERDSLDKLYPRQLATVADMVDHIDHAARLIGVEYLGIGSDFDGGAGLADCYDVSQMENITAALLKRGYSKQQISKIWGKNFLRVWQQVLDRAEKRR